MKRVIIAVDEDIEAGSENKCMFSMDNIFDLLKQIKELHGCRISYGTNENDILVFEIGNTEYPVTHEDNAV